MGRVRITRPFVLLALAAVLAPRVEASRTGAWERNPPAAVVLAKADAASALAALAPAADADVEAAEPPLFDLGEVVLVDRELEHEDRLSLGSLSLLGPAPLRGPPSSYPETRVGGFELLPPFAVGASPRLSLWGRQACGFSCREVASDSRYDPWGLYLETPIDLLSLGMDVVFAGIDVARDGKVSQETKLALAADLLTLSLPGAAGGGLAVHASASGARAVSAATKARLAKDAALAASKAPWLASHMSSSVRPQEGAQSSGSGGGGPKLASSHIPLPGTKRGWTPERAKEWLASLPSKKTPTTGKKNVYEITHTGPENRLVEGGGAKFWTDGILLEDGAIQEAKMVVKPDASPFIPGTRGNPEVKQIINDQVRGEFERMSKIIGDPGNPLTSVEVIVNNAEARPFFEGLLKEYQIPGRVAVKP
jgi:hypothetical protein